MAESKRSIYTFAVWRDEHRNAVLKTIQSVYDAAIETGTRSGMRDQHIQRLLKHKKRWEKAYSLERQANFKFSVVQEIDNPWHDLNVWMELDIDQGYSSDEIEVKVEVRSDSNSMSPANAGKLSALLGEVSLLAAKAQNDLNACFEALPADLIDPAKELASQKRHTRRQWIKNEIEDWKVLCFVQNTLLPMFEGEGTLVHRFEGKERKLLNKVPESVAHIEHERGGPSTITLTQGTLEHIAQKQADEEKKTKKKAA